MAEREYIGREEVRDALLFITNDTTCPLYIAAEIKQTLDLIPTADVAPVRHGKWIYDHWCEFKCSECGEYSNSKPYKGKEKYCFNCGARMDGDTNG